MSSALAASDALAKAGIYGFLAAVFGSHPTPESVSALPAIAAELGIACPAGLSLQELDAEYMALFVVPGPRYTAPYESVFRDEFLLPAVLPRGSNPGETGCTIKGLLMGDSTLAVRRCYLEAALLPEEDLPDHIANELRFLAYLSASEAQAISGLGERFRREHISQWIGELRERIVERESLGFYGAAIRVAEALLQEDDSRPPAG